MTNIQTVTLKSGHEVAAALVALVTQHLRRWMDGGIPGVCTFCDATELARNPEFEPSFSTIGEITAALLEGGRMHGDIREIIKCSVTGEGFDLLLVSPLMGEV